MTLPKQILTVREVGDLDLPYWSAASDDGEQLILEQGETQLWAGRCRVRSLRPKQWSLPETTLLVVTDRRTAFLTTAFDKGGGWAGFGVAGLAFATTANAVSKHRAATRSAGKVAIGHLRHEWVQAVELRRVKALIGGVSTYLDITVATAGGSTVIELWGRVVANEKIAQWLVSTVAWQRLGLTVEIEAQDRATLELLSKADGAAESARLSRSAKWQLPGNAERLISAARACAAVSSNAATSDGTSQWICPECRGLVAAEALARHPRNCAGRRVETASASRTAAADRAAKRVCPDCGKLVAGDAWTLHPRYCANRKVETAAPSRAGASGRAAMWVCPDCGKPVAPDALVLHHENCADRKAKAIAPGDGVPSSENVKAICPDCGKPVATETLALHPRYCAGRKVETTAANGTPTSNPAAKSICPDCNKLVAGNAWGLHHQHCAGRMG
jgi:predicted RNA-binding Zn-ribbon protein involved in translation (DUF1610 family)